MQCSRVLAFIYPLYKWLVNQTLSLYFCLKIFRSLPTVLRSNARWVVPASRRERVAAKLPRRESAVRDRVPVLHDGPQQAGCRERQRATVCQNTRRQWVQLIYIFCLHIIILTYAPQMSLKYVLTIHENVTLYKKIKQFSVMYWTNVNRYIIDTYIWYRDG